MELVKEISQVKDPMLLGASTEIDRFALPRAFIVPLEGVTWHQF